MTNLSELVVQLAVVNNSFPSGHFYRFMKRKMIVHLPINDLNRKIVEPWPQYDNIVS